MPDEKELHADGEEINLRNIFERFLHRWQVFALFLITTFALGLVYLKLTLPVFQAESSIIVKDSKLAGKQDIEDFMSGDIFSSTKNLSTEIGIIQSRAVVLQAASKLNLKISCYGKRTISPDIPLYKNVPFRVEYFYLHPDFFNRPFSLRYISDDSLEFSVEADTKSVSDYSYKGTHRFGEKISTPYFELTLRAADLPEGAEKLNEYEFRIHSDEQLMSRIEGNLKVSPLNKDATIINITYRDNIKQRAREFLNALSAEYITRDINDKAAVATLTLKFIDEQLADISKELGSNETELQHYKEHNKTVNLSEEAKSYLERLNNIDADRIKAEMDLRSLDYLHNYVASNQDVEHLAPSSIGTPDPVLIQLITQLQTLQSRKKNLQFGAKENSPALKVIDAQIAETKSLLTENINNMRERIRGTAKELGNELSQYEDNIRRIPSIERELIGLQRKFDVNQSIFLYLLQKKAETSIARATVVSDNKVLDDASVSDIPVKPSRKLVLMICLLLAFFLPATGILMLDFIQNKISSRDEIERLTKIPVIGIVGHMKEAGTRLVVHNKPKSSISEAFRSIRTNLAFFGMSEHNNVILITSSVGGEGKSFTAVNLASVLALQNNKVIIVALDLRKSVLAQDFGLDNKKGVSTYLIGQSALDEIIYKTEVGNLEFIPSGPVPPNPAELISKPECAELIRILKEKYDYVIVDTPPIGIVADALLLMKHSNLNIFILRQSYSRKENLKQINEYHRSGVIQHVSILFNDAGKMHSYGYGYGYYDEEHRKKKLFRRFFGRG
jgi:capsular exopolysaccharide synthesis family protein